MSGRAGDIWVFQSASPLLGLTLTLVVCHAAVAIRNWLNGNALANPVLLSVATLSILLWLTETPYATYFDGAQFFHFLLGPATVTLAIPLYAQFDRLRRLALPIVLALLVGSLTAAFSAVLIGSMFGASTTALISLAPKSATTPIAMGIAERLGGLPSLTAVLVILTGILGAVCAAPLFRVLRISDPGVRGFALGVLSHGIGTARAFQDNEEAGRLRRVGHGPQWSDNSPAAARIAAAPAGLAALTQQPIAAHCPQCELISRSC